MKRELGRDDIYQNTLMARKNLSLFIIDTETSGEEEFLNRIFPLLHFFLFFTLKE